MDDRELRALKQLAGDTNWQYSKRKPYIDAKRGLLTGDLIPLAKLLQADNLDDGLRKILIKMILGNEKETDWILKAKPNRTFGNARSNHQNQRHKQRERFEIACWLFDNGIQQEGMYESALSEGESVFNKGRSTLADIWKDYRLHALWAAGEIHHDEPDLSSNLQFRFIPSDKVNPEN